MDYACTFNYRGPDKDASVILCVEASSVNDAKVKGLRAAQTRFAKLLNRSFIPAKYVRSDGPPICLEVL